MNSEDTRLPNSRKYEVKTLQQKQQQQAAQAAQAIQAQATQALQTQAAQQGPIVPQQAQLLYPAQQPLQVPQTYLLPMAAPVMMPTPAVPQVPQVQTLAAPLQVHDPRDEYKRKTRPRQDYGDVRRERDYSYERRDVYGPDYRGSGGAYPNYDQRESYQPDYTQRDFYDEDELELPPPNEKGQKKMGRRSHYKNDGLVWKPCYTVLLVIVILLILGAIAVAIWAGITYTS